MPGSTRAPSPPPPYAGAAAPPAPPPPPVAPAEPGFLQRLFGGVPGADAPPPVAQTAVQAQTLAQLPVFPAMQLQQQQGSGGPHPAGGSRRRRTEQVPPRAIEVPMGLPRDESHTIVAMIVDRSGSMGSMGSEVEGGCNAYLAKQRAEDAADGTTTNVIVTRFDNMVETIINKPLTEVADITHDDVKPRGSTALYDAIGEAMTNVAAVLNEKHRESTPHVVIFILTDGAENASQRWTKKLVTDEITRLQAPAVGWEFYFAAANQDAMHEGRKLGMSADNCMSWNASAGKGNIKKSMAFVQEAHSRVKKGMRRGWTAAERMECME